MVGFAEILGLDIAPMPQAPVPGQAQGSLGPIASQIASLSNAAPSLQGRVQAHAPESAKASMPSPAKLVATAQPQKTASLSSTDSKIVALPKPTQAKKRVIAPVATSQLPAKAQKTLTKAQKIAAYHAELMAEEAEKKPPQKMRPFTNQANNVYDAFSGVAALSLKVNNVYHLVTHTEKPSYMHTYDLMGFANIASSAMSIVEGAEQFNAARKTDDVAGKFFGVMKFIKSIIEVVTGVPMLPVEYYKAILAVLDKTHTGVFAHVFGGIQGALTLLYGVLSLIPSSYKTYLSLRFGAQFYKSMQGLEGDDKAIAGFKFLKDYFHIGQKDVDQAFKTIQKKWIKNEKEPPLAVWEKKLIEKKYKGIEKLVDASIEVYAQELESAKHVDYQSVAMCRNPVFKACVMRELFKAEKRKASKLARAIGVDAFQAVKKEFAKPLESQLITKIEKGTLTEADKKSLQALITKTWLGTTIETLLRGSLAAAAIVGMTILIASFLPVGPIVGLILIALSLGISGVTLGVNLYDLAMGFKHESDGRYDALFLLFGGLIVSAVVTVGLIFTSGLAGFALLGTIVGAWMLLSLALVLYRLYANKKKKKEAAKQPIQI